jgi:hypothetical protein
MQSLDQKLFYLQSISEALNTQRLALIALRESINETHTKIANQGRRMRRRREREREREKKNLMAIFMFYAWRTYLCRSTRAPPTTK